MRQGWPDAQLLADQALSLGPGDKALELRAVLLSRVAYTVQLPEREGSSTTPWAAALQSSPAAGAAAVRLACDLCSQLPTEADVDIGFGLHSGGRPRALTNDLLAAHRVLLEACDLPQLLDQGLVGVEECRRSPRRP